MARKSDQAMSWRLRSYAIIGHVVHLVNRDYEEMARDYYKCAVGALPLCLLATLLSCLLCFRVETGVFALSAHGKSLRHLRSHSVGRLQFLDESVDVTPIVPALAAFFDDVLEASVSELNFKTITDGARWRRRAKATF